MKSSKFLFGLTFIMLGLAIGTGINYLDLRQLETRIPGGGSANWTPSGKPSDSSGVYQLLKSKDEFRKSLQPWIVEDLMRDYSTMDDVIGREFQDVHHSVSQKKSEVLQNMKVFLLLTAGWGLLAIRKSRKERV